MISALSTALSGLHAAAARAERAATRIVHAGAGAANAVSRAPGEGGIVPPPGTAPAREIAPDGDALVTGLVELTLAATGYKAAARVAASAAGMQKSLIDIVR